MKRISKSEFKLLMKKYINKGYTEEEAYEMVEELVNNSL